MPILIITYYCQLNEVTKLLGIYEASRRVDAEKMIEAYIALHNISREGITIKGNYLNFPINMEGLLL